EPEQDSAVTSGE
nr:Chain E, Pancreas/duodenum homeobox protein 1 [Mesocricetus auratus]6F8G_F Chain F, Pancreas/duodenum homeobox protein 1 [Mesocricetus auratus]6F8G_G Chain G, Pancreas/duodenum homeobox protein 1 [Mesocricetus auratus]6F8G_H Chain H, Pancreas/duodenum homeobox protein 1 [Mesocricetus auratus]